MPYLLDGEQRVAVSKLRTSLPFLTVNNTAYFLYVGYSLVPFTPKFVAAFVEVLGGVVQTAEVGIFSSPLAPNKAAQALTKLVATGVVNALTGVGAVRNTVAFATQIAAGVHVWVGLRTAMSVAEPTFSGLGSDMGEGVALVTAAAGALTAAGPFAGTVVAAASIATPIAPDLRLELD
jgi:hypothetical protein